MLGVDPVAVSVKAGDKAPKASLSTPADLLKIMEASKVKYVVHKLSNLEGVPASEFGETLWPTRGQPLAWPYVEKGAGGKATLVSYPASAEAIDALGAADALFQKKDYDAAETAYLDVIRRFPDYYRAHLFLGDIAFFGKGDNAAALAEYREGIRLNPFDYSGYLFAGHALAKLGRNEEALDAWVHALSLRAYQDTTLELAARYAEALGITPHPERFEPKAFVRREGDDVAIYIEPSAHWMAWANCKAVWLAEPKYRSSRGVEGTNDWSSAEDRECMAHLLILYGESLEDGKAPAEPQLDRLYSILESKLLTEYVVYEFGTRFDPNTLLLLDPSAFRIEDLVRAYILPKTR